MTNLHSTFFFSDTPIFKTDLDTSNHFNDDLLGGKFLFLLLLSSFVQASRDSKAWAWHKKG